MVLRGAAARSIIRSRTAGADPRPLRNGNSRAAQPGGTFPAGTSPGEGTPRRDRAGAAASRQGQRRRSPCACPCSQTESRGQMAAGCRGAVGGGGARDLRAHEDIGTRRRTSTDLVPRTRIPTRLGGSEGCVRGPGRPFCGRDRERSRRRRPTVRSHERRSHERQGVGRRWQGDGAIAFPRIRASRLRGRPPRPGRRIRNPAAILRPPRHPDRKPGDAGADRCPLRG